MTASIDLPAADAHRQAIGPMRIVLWTVLFQIAWFWRRIPDLLSQGAMPDTDDFQRLAQIRAWMSGQGWFDVVNYRMDPPLGADMHWSRLVDVPIAGLMWMFDPVVGPVLAERLAALIWPLMLLVATVFVVLATCRRIHPGAHPLVTLLFTVTCITALQEFMPGRIDHHNLQILLFCLMLLGLVSTNRRWGHVLMGAAMAASISIGLDAILIIAFLLAWLGLDWVRGRDLHGRGLAMTALGMAGAALPLYAGNIAPADWFVLRCDANSFFYLLALGLGSLGFVILAAGSRLPVLNGAHALPARLAAGAMAGASILVLLAMVAPHCLAGPYGELSPELVDRWLVNVNEAQGMLVLAERVPQLWLHGGAYGLLLVAVAAFVVLRADDRRQEKLALLAVLLIALLAGLIQYRSVRIGIFAAIPFAVVFSAWFADWLSQRSIRPIAAGAMQVGVVALLSSPLWVAISAVAFPDRPARGLVAEAAHAGAPQIAGWRDADPYIFCNRQSDYARLASLPPGLVMSDINSGPEIPIFTRHDAVGGPYHRNRRAILDMVDFFETTPQKAREIAKARGIAYVAWCEPLEAADPEELKSGMLAAEILRGASIDWLVRVSPREERLHVFRVEGL